MINYFRGSSAGGGKKRKKKKLAYSVSMELHRVAQK
jgi:hypothetical protein